MRYTWFCARCHALNPIAEEKCPTIRCRSTRQEFESAIRPLTFRQFVALLLGRQSREVQ